MGQIFIVSSLSAFMLIQYIVSCASSCVFSIPMWFRCSCFSVLPCSTMGIFIQLPFITVTSMIAISSLNDQYACRSFCISALVDGQPQSSSSDSMPMCSSSSITILISSALMQSSMSMHDSVEVMVIHMPGISSSLFGCVWIASL